VPPAVGRAADALTRLRRTARVGLSIRVLPVRVGWFWLRARRHARSSGDRFSLASAARPSELAQLLALAHRRSAVVELGTGTAWTAAALVLHNSKREVITYDPCVRAEREAYLDLAGRSRRNRIELRDVPDSCGPRARDPPVQLPFIDSSHDRESVVRAFGAWRDALAPGAIVVFHDYGHPDYPGVREAVLELGLSGRNSEGLFVWRAPP